MPSAFFSTRKRISVWSRLLPVLPSPMVIIRPRQL
jgi:hypothetical protein